MSFTWSIRMMKVHFWSYKIKAVNKKVFEAKLEYFGRSISLILAKTKLCSILLEIFNFFLVFHFNVFNFVKEVLKIFVFWTIFYTKILQNLIIYFFKTIPYTTMLIIFWDSWLLNKFSFHHRWNEAWSFVINWYIRVASRVTEQDLRF